MKWSWRIWVGVCAPLGALAQTPADLEYTQVEVEEADRPFNATGGFSTSLFEYNNLDFRSLDESSDQAILDSDDRGAFATTGVSVELGYRIEEHLRLVLGASHRGVWGDDQLGNVNAFGGFAYLGALYIDADIPLGSYTPTLRIGRQYYEIGTLGGAPDYILSDVVDAIRLDLPLGSAGTLSLLPVNVFSSSTDADGANFLRYTGQSDLETFNFRGDTLTRRMGGTLTIDGIGGPLDIALYSFYTDIGARGTGSDISYDGLLGNFSDNDWTLNAGLRTAVAAGPLSAFAHFDMSRGMDRKELVAQDVNCNGFAWGAGALVSTGEEDGFDGSATYFDALGAGYSKDGLQYTHGYVGMKARQAGGLIANRFLGWHPTAYVGSWGIDDNPHEMSRKAGTRVLHADAGARLPGPLKLSVGWWLLQDTGITFLAPGRIDEIDPPFGHARAAYPAQERLGKTLGQELNLDLGLTASEHLDFFATGGMLLGSSFHAIEIARIAGSALGSKDPAMPWAASLGTSVRF
jgi:hypothetical protein